MKKTRYIEEQIAFALKSALALRKCVEKWAFMRLLFMFRTSCKYPTKTAHSFYAQALRFRTPGNNTTIVITQANDWFSA